MNEPNISKLIVISFPTIRQQMIFVLFMFRHLTKLLMYLLKLIYLDAFAILSPSSRWDLHLHLKLEEGGDDVIKEGNIGDIILG